MAGMHAPPSPRAMEGLIRRALAGHAVARRQTFGGLRQLQASENST